MAFDDGAMKRRIFVHERVLLHDRERVAVVALIGRDLLLQFSAEFRAGFYQHGAACRRGARDRALRGYVRTSAAAYQSNESGEAAATTICFMAAELGYRSRSPSTGRARG